MRRARAPARSRRARFSIAPAHSSTATLPCAAPPCGTASKTSRCGRIRYELVVALEAAKRSVEMISNTVAEMLASNRAMTSGQTILQQSEFAGEQSLGTGVLPEPAERAQIEDSPALRAIEKLNDEFEKQFQGRLSVNRLSSQQVESRLPMVQIQGSLLSWFGGTLPQQIRNL